LLFITDIATTLFAGGSRRHPCVRFLCFASMADPSVRDGLGCPSRVSLDAAPFPYGGKEPETDSAHARIYLGPARRREINDLLTQLAALELHNGFTAAGDPTFAGRSEIKTQATLGDLREASPEVDEELKRRLKAKSANE
jgi:hypothetical protein